MGLIVATAAIILVCLVGGWNHECPLKFVCCDVLNTNDSRSEPNVESNSAAPSLAEEYIPTHPPVSSVPQNTFPTEPDVPITYWPPKKSVPQTNDGANDEQPNPTKLTPPGDRKNTAGLFPWVVALFYEGAYLTGGTLIGPKVILTGAHGIMHNMIEYKIEVRAGEFVMNTPNETCSYEKRVVERIVRHEGFIEWRRINNVALIFVKTPFVLNDRIGVLALPRPEASFVGRLCTFAGWKMVSSQGQSPTGIMTNFELPVVDRKTCETQFRSIYSNWNLDSSLICAGGEIERKICGEGFALFCSLGEGNTHVYEQVGIEAWCMGSRLKALPGLYTNVTMFRSWIDERIASYG
ncbi:phenoloxidase-activating factor 2 [Drosophila sechellia]|uniref:phenoloxidase-activating factor 2 n=1 Tax=Drosophila sechellia TaxID=7238 RepID=UPI0013DD8CD2|nr:phenoloxidase-activating factor 2 [Drosophila sechellia]